MAVDESRNNTFITIQWRQMKRQGSPLLFEYANATAAPAASQPSPGRVCGRGDGGGLVVVVVVGVCGGEGLECYNTCLVIRPGSVLAGVHGGVSLSANLLIWWI